MSESASESEAKVTKLLNNLKRRELRHATEAITRFKSDFISAAERAKIPKAPKKLSPFVYQLR